MGDLGWFQQVAEVGKFSYFFLMVFKHCYLQIKEPEVSFDISIFRYHPPNRRKYARYIAHMTQNREKCNLLQGAPVFVARILLAQVTIPWACAVYFAGNVFWNRKLTRSIPDPTDRQEDEEEIYSGHKAKRKDVQLFETLIEA